MIQQFWNYSKKQLFWFDKNQFILAVRAFLITVLGILAAYFFLPDQYLWIIFTSNILLLVYSFLPKRNAHKTIWIFIVGSTILVPIFGYIALSTPVAWFCIFALMFIGCYLNIFGINISLVSLFGMVLLIISVCFPAHFSEVLMRGVGVLIGSLICYGVVLIPLVKKTNAHDQINYYVNTLMLLSNQTLKHLLRENTNQASYYFKAREMLSELRRVSDTNIQDFFYLYAKIFHILMSIQRIKLIAFTQTSQAALQTLQKVLKTIQADMMSNLQDKSHQSQDEFEKLFTKADLAKKQLCKEIMSTKNSPIDRLQMSSLYYLIDKLVVENHQLYLTLDQFKQSGLLKRLKHVSLKP